MENLQYCSQEIRNKGINTEECRWCQNFGPIEKCHNLTPRYVYQSLLFFFPSYSTIHLENLFSYKIPGFLLES